MANLFEYATKELSQDAFLRWLFESYRDDDEDVSACAKKLLIEFCHLKGKKDITGLVTTAQSGKIDIIVDFQYGDEDISLYIEDKTFSEEHSKQLKKYNSYIEKRNDSKKYRVFYKTSELSEHDKLVTESEGWIPYNIYEIYSLYDEFKNSKNIILKQYIDYIFEVKNACSNKEKPNSSNTKIDLIKWVSYFNYIFKDKIDPKYTRQECDVTKYSYVYFAVGKKEKMPYIEMRSRDNCTDTFCVRLLCYDVENFQPQQKVIEFIKSGKTEFKAKNITSRNGKLAKQIGIYSKKGIDTDEKVVAEFKKCLEEYKKIMNIWENNNL
jgi:hypothetical protein